MPSPFDAYAEEYDSWYRDNQALFEEELEGILDLGLTGLGLEVGVGTGVFAAPVGVRLGLDPSPPMLRKARDRGIAVVRGIAERLPFREESFDFVLMTTTLCFLNDPVRSLSEIGRALKPQGSLGLCLIPRDSPWGALYEAKAGEGHPIYSAARFYTVREVRKMLQESNFSVERTISKLTHPPEGRPSSGKASFVCLKARKAHSTR